MRQLGSSSSIAATYRTKALLATAIAAGVVMLGGAAYATPMINFSEKNNPQPNEQNVMFEALQSDQTSFFGDTNKTNTPIEFNLITSAGETEIGTDGKGQADIVCNMGCGTDSKGGADGMQLTDLEIMIGSGFGATDFIGNLDFGEGSAQIDVTNQSGAVFDYILGKGQNFFTLTATGGAVITDIQITESAPDTKGNWGWNDFKQPRVSGICALNSNGTCTTIPVPVPEPSSLALLGAGLLAAGWFGMRRKGRNQDGLPQI